MSRRKPEPYAWSMEVGRLLIFLCASFVSTHSVAVPLTFSLAPPGGSGTIAGASLSGMVDGDLTISGGGLGTFTVAPGNTVQADDLSLDSFIDPTTPITSSGGYDVFLTSATLTGLSLEIGGGPIVEGSTTALPVTSIQGALSASLVFDCTTFGCALAGGDGSGSTTASVSLGGSGSEVRFALNSGGTASDPWSLDATVLLNPTAGNIAVSSPTPWTNFLLPTVQQSLVNGFYGDFRTTPISGSFSSMATTGGASAPVLEAPIQTLLSAGLLAMCVSRRWRPA